jgi:hypothetical protein
MPRTCNHYGCESTAIKIVDSNGVTDPSKDRWEQYECEYGHTFSVTLRGTEA